MTIFTELPLSAALQQKLAAAQFITLTPIQARAISPALEGKDVIGTAQTGTGKTLAFLIPIIEMLRAESSKQESSKQVRALVLLPTRELAMQVHEQYEQLRDTASEYYDQGRQKAQEWQQGLEEYVHEQPVKALPALVRALGRPLHQTTGTYSDVRYLRCSRPAATAPLSRWCGPGGSDVWKVVVGPGVGPTARSNEKWVPKEGPRRRAFLPVGPGSWGSGRRACTSPAAAAAARPQSS